MIKARTWLSLVIMGVATIAATASCGSDEGTGGGGTVLGNAGNAGNAGNVATGGESGGAGRSSMGRAGSTSTAGTSGTGGGSVNEPVSNLGGKCTSDKECGDGLVCLTVNSTELAGGGPAGGLCTLPCTMGSDCSAIEPGSDCFNFGTMTAPKLYCLEGCELGGDETTAAHKCQGRGDFACANVSADDPNATFCVPGCRSDLECGTGLYCDKGNGVCTKTKPTGDPVGTACTPDTLDANNQLVPGSGNCQGFCLNNNDGATPPKGVCAEFCSGYLACGYTGDKPGGLCFGQFQETFGPFDLGFCLPNCGCSADCPFPGDACRAWPTAQQSFADELGAPGLCVGKITDSVELTKCADGEGGAGGAPGTPGGDAGASGASGASN